jgi:hypothetical protein
MRKGPNGELELIESLRDVSSDDNDINNDEAETLVFFEKKEL